MYRKEQWVCNGYNAAKSPRMRKRGMMNAETGRCRVSDHAAFDKICSPTSALRRVYVKLKVKVKVKVKMRWTDMTIHHVVCRVGHVRHARRPHHPISARYG